MKQKKKKSVHVRLPEELIKFMKDEDYCITKTVTRVMTEYLQKEKELIIV